MLKLNKVVIGANCKLKSYVSLKDIILAVKDQSGCGSCWTYPATALLEFAIRQATNEKIPLSEQVGFNRLLISYKSMKKLSTQTFKKRAME